MDQLAELGSSLVPYVLQVAFNTLFVIGTRFVLDARLMCLILPLMPLFFVFRRHFENQLRSASDSAQQESSRESSFLQEHLGAVTQIQLLHREQSQTQVFLERATARVKALNHRNLVEILFRTCYMMVIALGTISILGYGGHRVPVLDFAPGGNLTFYTHPPPPVHLPNAAVHIYASLNTRRSRLRNILYHLVL